jgi:hypothetical protein
VGLIILMPPTPPILFHSSQNPNGIQSLSPGLRGTNYPGNATGNHQP